MLETIEMNVCDLIKLKGNTLARSEEAYKYTSDLKFYARGELTKDVESLAEQIKLRLEEGLSFAGEELLAKAEVIAHKVSLGFEEV